MFRQRLQWLGLSVLALAWGCTYMAPRIPMSGTPGDLERLAGEWWGDYVGDRDHARRGSITFKLVAGENHAHGDVLMIPEGRNRPYQRNQDDEARAQSRELPPMTPVLSIRFVNVADGSVSGVLDPYWDPDRLTEAVATFRGRVSGHTIEGTFVTKYSNGSADTGGRWKVTRKR